MLQERWPLWKAGLYNLEMISPQRCNFQMGRLAYDKTIINEILQDLINTGEMTSFINDVIVKIKEEE